MRAMKRGPYRGAIPTTDVLIVGGGVMGAALAYQLTRLDPTVRVLVIERDPTYAEASSVLSAAGVRQQFSTAVNIAIAQAAIEFLRAAPELLAINGVQPQIGLTEQGYLYLANESQRANLQQAHALQRAAGADVLLLEVADLNRRFPWLSTHSLAAGSLGVSGEGWFDGQSLLQALIAKAKAHGVQFRVGNVVGIEQAAHAVRGVRLSDGTMLSCAWAVNAAGPWAQQLAGFAGLHVPVVARPRTVYVVSCPTPIPRCPLVIDTSGFWLRPEGQYFIGGVVPSVDCDAGPLTPDWDGFERDFWPALSRRIPAFEAARLVRAWAGYYEYNTFDQNGLVGLHPALDNFIFMNGFSGHGIQQAPIIAQAMAELMLGGRYESVDVSDLSVERLVTGVPLRELNVIG
jgi:glycine/D-amino acid oxidase-like deaminating enzyme